MRRGLLSIAVVAAIGLVACGGGGGAPPDEGAATATSPVTQSPLAIGTEPEGMAANPVTKKLYVANEVETEEPGTETCADSGEAGGEAGEAGEGEEGLEPGVLTVVDTITFSIVKQIPISSDSEYLAVDTARNLVFVANRPTNRVTVVDGATDTVAAEISFTTNGFPVGEVEGLGVDELDGMVYVAVKNPSAIYVLDGAKLAAALAAPDPGPKAIALADVLAMTIPSGVDPEALVFNPVNRMVYAANEESDNVTIATAVTRDGEGYSGGEVLNPGAEPVFTDVCRGEDGVVYPIDDYGEADKLAVGPDGAVYLTDDRHRIAKFVDAAVVGRLTIPGFSCEQGNRGRNTANNLRVAGKWVVVASEQSSLAVVDGDTLELRGFVDVPSTCHIDAISVGAGDRVYVTDERTGKLYDVGHPWDGPLYSAPPAFSVSLATDVPSPQVIGTAVTFTATGTGSSGYQYRFYARAPGGSMYTMVRDYGVGSTWTLPGTAAAGQWSVLVYVRTRDSVPLDAQSYKLFTVRDPPPAATGVTLSTSLPSPQASGTPIVFTAAGTGSSGYQYRFYAKAPGAMSYSMVQDYSSADTWTLPVTSAPGQWSVLVYVRTRPEVLVEAQAFRLFTIRAPPATGVTLTANLASPQAAGTPIVFTATGAGSSGYQYRFYLKTPGASVYTLVQDYGIGSTWTMPSTYGVGQYSVLVYVRTNTNVLVDAQAYRQFTLRSPPATGVALATSLASPQPAGTPITFTAAGTGSSGYQYRFYAKAPGATSYSMVQDYGVGSTWTLPGTAAPGQWSVLVYVRTSTTVLVDAQAYKLFTVGTVP